MWIGSGKFSQIPYILNQKISKIIKKIKKSNLWWGAYQPVFIRIALMIHNAMVVAEGIYQVDTLETVFITLPVYFRFETQKMKTQKSRGSIIYESYFNVIRSVLPFRSSLISNI